MKFADRAQYIKDLRISLIFPFIVLALVLAGIWAWRNFLDSPPYVDLERYPIRGIDVSRHNGMMNLDAAAKDGIDFIFIKASEGESLRDPNFRLNYEKARHAGLAIGAYHFFRFDVGGVAQARNFLAAVGDRPLDLGPATDVEEHGNKPTDPELVKDRLRAMAEFLYLSGHRVIFYTNRDGYYDLLRDAMPGAPLWICSFNRIPIQAEWTFWQYSHRGRVAGIRGDVDLNAFVGSRADWKRLLSTGSIEQ